MEEIIKQLTPIEKLFLISQEKNDVYDKQNKVFCLLYSLMDKRCLKVTSNNKDFKVSYGKGDFPKDYETMALDLLKEKKYLELDKFIESNLVFNKTLLQLSILVEKMGTRKIMFFTIPSVELEKTSLYYNLQGHYKELMEKQSVISVLCNDINIYNKTKNAYIVLKTNMKKAALDLEEAKAKARFKESEQDGKKKPTVKVMSSMRN